LLASLGDAGHHLFGYIGVQFARGKVIHKEQRSRPLHRDVVHAVIHQVTPNGVVKVHLRSNLQLRPNAVHAGDQNWIGILFVQGKHPAEAANLTQHALVKSLVS
jgi:hypothetical protein